MKNRMYPFGYKMENGAVVIVPEEAEIIRKIFNDYISGVSLKRIAESLTAKRIEYLPDRWQWNKNRVVRIIDDVRYLGNGVYDVLIEHDLFEMSQAVKKKRNTQTEYDRDKVISPSVTDIVCGCCGSMVERVHDNRNTFCQKYVCVNPHCKSVYIISESEMLCMIRDLLKHSKLSIITNDEETDPLQIHKREQEVSRAIDYATDDYEKARQMILECAREKYRIASQGRAAYDKLQSRLTDANFQINRYTVAELIRRIRLLTDDEIEITLINGQTLNKEQKDGTNQSR